MGQHFMGTCRCHHAPVHFGHHVCRAKRHVQPLMLAPLHSLAALPLRHLPVLQPLLLLPMPQPLLL